MQYQSFLLKVSSSSFSGESYLWHKYFYTFFRLLVKKYRITVWQKFRKHLSFWLLKTHSLTYITSELHTNVPIPQRFFDTFWPALPYCSDFWYFLTGPPLLLYDTSSLLTTEIVDYFICSHDLRMLHNFVHPVFPSRQWC